jgi:hypothetical protein
LKLNLLKLKNRHYSLAVEKHNVIVRAPNESSRVESSRVGHVTGRVGSKKFLTRAESSRVELS